jgi:hypothetical protein
LLRGKREGQQAEGRSQQTGGNWQTTHRGIT